MKKIIIFTIFCYQKVISIILKNVLGINKFCRYSPTCSEYARLKIKENGVLKGGALSLIRIAKCHPFTKAV
jgi:uncharacterized protein